MITHLLSWDFVIKNDKQEWIGNNDGPYCHNHAKQGQFSSYEVLQIILPFDKDDSHYSNAKAPRDAAANVEASQEVDEAAEVFSQQQTDQWKRKWQVVRFILVLTTGDNKDVCKHSCSVHSSAIKCCIVLYCNSLLTMHVTHDITIMNEILNGHTKN